ncbi:threonine synthase [Blattabacterium cuenoti]|uniref:threonine synthase n=1 Tax=Blattabacterium cuenoti TaxID=1653831 RepID=UPI00163C00D3|nr:threonine synthase [Blattabacterium cuenoti]
MLYHSLTNRNNLSSFEHTVLSGLSSDGDLYVPQSIPRLNPSFFEQITSYDIHHIAREVIIPYIGNSIPDDRIEEIIKNTIQFDFPIKNIHDNIYALELFHGPTLAFKDIGAKFMSECLSYFYEKIGKKFTVLVATSGDTGGAVAKGFNNKSGIEVIILYPHNGISPLQEKQIASLNSSNVFALEIFGNFDDCQKMVKKAFSDKQIKKKYTLTSANSINTARLLPQMFYYFSAYKNIKEMYGGKKIIFSVPSGNFGNICAGMIAERMGLPIHGFVASTNINDTIPRFMKSGIYHPINVKKTISNAMDIANPSNFPRIWNFLYKKNMFSLKKKLSSFRFTDYNTLSMIKKVWKNHKYMLDPHGAVGYLGATKYLYKDPKTPYLSVFLETAHPVKFLDKIPFSLRKEVFFPKKIKKFLKSIGEVKKNAIKNNFNEFKNWLLDRSI